LTPNATGVGPGRALVGWPGEHREQARRVGAELGDELARLDHVVLRLAHLLDAAEHQRQAVLPGGGADRRATFVVPHVDFARVVPALLAAGVFAVEALVE
jgi:hypothetical protein